MHAFTYSAHPVGCAVALRMLDIIEREAFAARAASLGDHLLGQLRARLEDHSHVGDIRGKGLMCAIELVQDRRTKAEFSPAEQVGARVTAEAMKRGLFTRRRADISDARPTRS